MAHEGTLDIDLSEVVATGERLPEALRFDPALLSAEDEDEGPSARVQRVSDEDEG